MALEKYQVREIPSRTAMEMVIEFHYLHRRASAMYTFGLFDLETDEMVGCIVYGKPASHAVCKGICGADEAGNVIELTRLWIADVTPKNAESYLIGNSLRLLPVEKDIVVSYAEIGAGHRGIVYQATNWTYVGMTDKHVMWNIDGEAVGHNRHRFDEYGGENKAKEILGDRMTPYYRPRKHRYVMFRGSKARKKELRSKLRYKIKPYPKDLSIEE